MFWKDGESSFSEFVSNLNTVNPNVQFTYEFSSDKLAFLDTQIVKTDTSPLGFISEPHSKPTDAHLFLPFASSHPFHVKRAIPKGQFLRIRRICSTTSIYWKHARKLQQYFLNSGYPDLIVRQAMQEAAQTSRADLLYKESSRKRDLNRVPFVTTYNESAPKYLDCIKENWDILLQSNKFQSPLFRQPPMPSYRQPQNLRSLLCRSRFKQSEKFSIESIRLNSTSLRPCLKPRCKLCTIVNKNPIKAIDELSHKIANKDHIPNCTSDFVVYCLICDKCGQLYIGECTTPLNLRINNHRSTVLRKAKLPMAEHLNQPNHVGSSFKVAVCGRVLNGDVLALHRLESFFINELNTLYPNGINVHAELDKL